MAQNDRLTGLVGLVGMKVPVRAASTAALVLSGEQTVDGVALVTGDRVLVKDQASGADNGIYVVDTGTWARGDDCDGTYDLVKGSMVRANEGSFNGGGIFVLTSSDPITVGTTSLAWSRISINFISSASIVATAGQTLFNLGINYQLGSSNLAVYVNGLRQRVGADYAETSTSSITFTAGLQAGDEVDVYAGLAVGNLIAAAATAVAVTDAGDFYLGGTVEAILQEIRDAITPDNGDTSQVLSYNADTPIQRWNTPLTANRTATLDTANAKEGAHFVIVRGAGATGNFTLSVGALHALCAPGEWAEVRYDAGTAAWVLEKYGFLPSAGLASLQADVGDADAVLTVSSSSQTQRWETPLTTDRTASLSAVGAWRGAHFKIVRAETATGAFSLIVEGAARLARLAPGQWCTVAHNGSGWIITGFGDLRTGLSSLIELRDDFLGEEIDGYRWQSLIGTDAECRHAVVLPDQVGGVVRLVTGDDAAASMAVNGVQLHSQLNWRANKGGLVWEGQVTLSAITAVAIFIGLTDQRAALEMPFTLAAGDALTSNASDACGVLFDTNADTDNWWLVGVAADVDAVKQNTAQAPVAGTFETWRIELGAGGSASFYRNGVLIGVTMAGALTPSAQLTPVIAAFSRGAASRNIDVGLLRVQQQR